MSRVRPLTRIGRATLGVVAWATGANVFDSGSAAAQRLADQPPFVGEESVSFYTLDSRPAGARMSLRGGTRLEGAAPLTIPGDVYGSFHIDIQAPGHERQRGLVNFPGSGGPLDLSSELGSGAGSIVASLVWPGLGEIMRGEGDGLRGFSFLTAGAGGVTGLLGAELRRRDGEKDAEESRARAARATSIQQRTAFRIDEARQAAIADRARAARLDWALICAAAWGVSLIDTYRWTPRLQDAQVDLTDATFTLKPLSRQQAALRSIVPGLGQHYAGRRGAGALAFFGGLAAGVALVVAEHNYEEAVQRMAALQTLYQDPVADPEALRMIRPALEDEASKADVARKRRNTLGAVAAGVWAANMLDAVLSTPTSERGGGPPARPGDLGVKPKLRFGAALGTGSGAASMPKRVVPTVILRVAF